MDTPLNKNLLNFIKSELKKAQIKLSEKPNGREGVDFVIAENQLYLQYINLDTSQRFIKIKKQDLLQLDSNIFIENNVSLMPSLSNWEIKVSSNTIPELAKYALENMINKLKM